MRYSIAAGVLACISLASEALPQEAPAPGEVPPGEVDIVAMVVSADLEIKPVPRWRFLIESKDRVAELRTITTGFDGKTTLNLPPGQYEIRSVDPLQFDGSQYTWKLAFTVLNQETTIVELSNDNADVVRGPGANASVEVDEGTVYRRVKDSVFKVISEIGHGSGFLVHPSGLIVTNHHVVFGSDYLAVLLSPGHKHLARIVALDEVHDVAVLQVNPSVVEALTPVTLAKDDPASPPVSVGERVVAIGSPLATETILTSGLVSKVEEGAIYSDVSINPGNSGGPLFNLRGQVVGINTFGLASSGVGPGVAGIVRIHLAQSLIEGALKPGAPASPPLADPLPVEASFTFPAGELREELASRDLKASDYHLEVGKFDTQLITPVLVASLEIQNQREAAAFREKRNKNKNAKEFEQVDHFYEWRRYTGDYRPVVTLQVVPEIRMTTGSIFAVAMVGNAAPQKYRFKTDFDRMELRRGNVEVQPLWPGRVPNVVNLEAGLVSMKDVGYYGIYEYPPEAFKPGETLTVTVWKQGVEEPIVTTIPVELQNRIWADFKRYFESLERETQSPGR